MQRDIIVSASQQRLCRFPRPSKRRAGVKALIRPQMQMDALEEWRVVFLGLQRPNTPVPAHRKEIRQDIADEKFGRVETAAGESDGMVRKIVHERETS
jgi:hypothetical protein